MSALRRKVLALQSLSTNWDSYGALPITEEAVKRALELVNPAIVPTVAGGIQLEWHTGGIDLDVEVLPDGRIIVSMSHEEIEGAT